MKAILLGGDTLRLIADSALLRCNKPLFLDDPALWTLKVCPAVRISRLGFHIKEKFARRYYDSVSAVCVCLPNAYAEAPCRSPEIVMARDNCLIEGSWLNIDTTDNSARLDFSGNGKHASTTLGQLQVDKTIERLSQYMTFKTGDMLIFADCSINIAATDAHGEMETEINGTKSLGFRIK